MRTGRASWLILAADGPAIEVPDRVPSTIDPRHRRSEALPRRAARRTAPDRPVRTAAGGRGGAEHRGRGAAPTKRTCGPSTSRPPARSRSGSPRLRRASTTRWRPPPTRPSWPAASRGSRRRPVPGPARRSSCRWRRPRDRPRGARAATRRPGRPPPAEGVRPPGDARRSPRAGPTRDASCSTASGASEHAGDPRTVDVHVRWLRSQDRGRARAPAPRDGPRRRLSPR